MIGWVALPVSVLALGVSILSYQLARKTSHREGAALLEALVLPYPPTVKDAWEGTTGLTIKNRGPAIAEDVKVTITESEDQAEVRERERTHVTPVADRLGGDQADNSRDRCDRRTARCGCVVARLVGHTLDPS